MLIAIVTEFDQTNFQWRMAWTQRRFLKHNVVVRSFKFNQSTLAVYPKGHSYWRFLREADLVFVYCSRMDNWEWFKLPLYVKKLLKPKAKMIVQFDSEFLWIRDSGQMHWDPRRDLEKYKGKTAKQVFEMTGILDVADAYFTVLENPFWARYCKKPIYYMPLPQLVRYPNLPTNQLMKHKTIALIHHFARDASVRHTIENVTNPLKKPVCVFTCSIRRRRKECSEYAKELELPKGSYIYGFLVKNIYLDYLHRSYVGIEDTEGYEGWSRFAMECALLGVPCIGSSYANKLFFPELYTERKDYVKQRKLVKRLWWDKEFYEEMVEGGKKRVLEQLDTDGVCRRFVEIAKEIGTPQRAKKEMKEWRFIQFVLNLKTRRFPDRPNGTILDNNFKSKLTAEEWDEIYGQWDHNLYKKLLPLINQYRMSGY